MVSHWNRPRFSRPRGDPAGARDAMQEALAKVDASVTRRRPQEDDALGRCSVCRDQPKPTPCPNCGA
jgi:predicted RNA-binding Zn-ribbon protein involved in translation (DUF1610 family)